MYRSRWITSKSFCLKDEICYALQSEIHFFLAIFELASRICSRTNFNLNEQYGVPIRSEWSSNFRNNVTYIPLERISDRPAPLDHRDGVMS